jgi:crossover junction endodeoxyribonuclease RuvC
VVLFSECFRTSAKVSFEERLLSIGARVEELIKEYSPAGLAIENLFLSNNQKTAMRVAEVRGAIIYICRKNALFIQEFTPLQIKLSVTGSGASGKDQVIKMVNLLVTNLNKKALDDEYDAIAAGLAYFALNNPALK